MALELFNLSGRVAIVMGGTSGIGRAIALGMAEAGADVVATGRRAHLVAELADAIEKMGRKTLRRAVDASSRASIDTLRDEALKRLGRVDILVNSAGQIFRKP
ncbi:MAG: SDR family NAD(P)-dependent oxidoreductase, partial [Bryobacteraceae bacterium]